MMATPGPLLALKKVLAHRLSSTFGFLLLAQTSSYLFQLAMIPYLQRTVGPEGFGVITLALNMVTFFALLADYGINLTAVRRIAQQSEDVAAVQHLFSTIMALRVLLMGITGLLLAVLVISLPQYRAQAAAFALTFPWLVGQVLFPVWLFQGKQQLKVGTFINVGVKLVALLLTFAWVTSPAHYLRYAALNAGGNLLGGVLALAWAMHAYHLHWGKPGWAAVKQELIQGFPVMLTMTITAILYLNIGILRLFATEKVVGYYALPDRILQAIRQGLSIIFQAIYAHASQLALRSHAQLRRFYARIMPPLLLVVGIGCAALMVFAPQVIRLLAGQALPDATLVLRILSLSAFITALNLPFYQTLVVYDYRKDFSRILIAAAVVNITLNVLLSFSLQAVGTAIAVLITEVITTLGLMAILELRHPRQSLLRTIVR